MGDRRQLPTQHCGLPKHRLIGMCCNVHVVQRPQPCCLHALQEHSYKLSRAEKVQLVNLRPQSDLELQLVSCSWAG